ncbi:phosphate signaling complex protein PhoU [Leucobacter denitrificans]|uniref:Phosphate-specific transport system accessory protein PhoU n=1 Tax=Leucobacter denitrificans TaxID=683042 RepID=A0A7G9S3U7_9MICO|nr:phosphate signaling complex protein PhoU [Leucobacter denitrificans]QNN62522.1 phosphate signaling complex protein PhoU [Leucobacter denitrificans]
MRQVFQQSLSELQERLVGIAELVETSITEATQAFATSDAELAESVIERTEEVEALALELDELAINILLRESPVASDLRLVVSSLRMSSSLERMADLAQHIAQLARYRYPESAIPQGLRKIFSKMGAIDVEMASAVVTLLREQEPETVNVIRDLDDGLDKRHAKVFEKVLSDKLSANPLGVVDATLASRYHERFGDHAVSVAKQMQYFFSGELA